MRAKSLKEWQTLLSFFIANIIIIFLFLFLQSLCGEEMQPCGLAAFHPTQLGLMGTIRFIYFYCHCVLVFVFVFVLPVKNIFYIYIQQCRHPS